MNKTPAHYGALALAVALLTGCASTVRNYGAGDYFSGSEALSGSTSTPQQCAGTINAVWVEGPSFHECIRYFPSSDFSTGHVERAVVFMEGDVLSTSGASAGYEKWTPRRELEASQLEQQRGGTPYLTLARPGVDGSSGNQNRRRTQYETLVMNAALDQIKAHYGIREFGLVGQSGGGGLVGALIAERQDVVCAVSSSGVTSVVYRAREKGRRDDLTGVPLSDVWDPIAQLSRVHPMPGFRFFVTSDATDTDVSFTSQNDYVQAAKSAGLPVYQIMVHGGGSRHHQTYRIGNRVVEDCMLALPTDTIMRTYNDMDNRYNHMTELAARERALAAGASLPAGHDASDDRDATVGR
ncbi:alpha/beta fold hydrolase [Paraburkholderia sp. ZP32-5]|uniref:alpha/beta fold hydrolase n=1 Tax=Paraburkholderia sp. ZP32-5 TaxID=2883245 RepID=UPI001F290AEC|nr:alpha/beta fold hydrolase [Paraburkholderia sp. ZP32-5]